MGQFRQEMAAYLGEQVREADGSIKPGVSAANPGTSFQKEIESAKRTVALNENVGETLR
jgi:hypothetical protein